MKPNERIALFDLDSKTGNPMAQAVAARVLGHRGDSDVAINRTAVIKEHEGSYPKEWHDLVQKLKDDELTVQDGRHCWARRVDLVKALDRLVNPQCYRDEV